MAWQTGLTRLRLVGTVSLIVGVVACASVVVTRLLGYAPDASVASLFASLWPIGLGLSILGTLIWIAVWVLRGFAQAPAAVEPISRRAPIRE